MKVSAKDFKNAVVLFEGSIIDAEKDPTTAGLLTAAFATKADEVNKGIDDFAKDGMVETDEIRKFLDAWLAKCDKKIVFHPKFPKLLSLLGINVGTIEITEAQVNAFFDEMLPAVSASAIQ